MTSENIVIRFSEVAQQTTGLITRVIGFVPSRHIFPLFKQSILDANPRKPKVNKVTADIIDTLKTSPELFQYKSKGVLIGTANFEALQRNRYMLNFDDPQTEGILDGGHNMLSIGIYFLSLVLNERELRAIKTWEDLLHAWAENETELMEARDTVEFLIPVELLVPSADDEDVQHQFNVALIDICAARNNNAQLAEEAKANQKGFYEEIRERFENKHPELAKRVEWKTNEWEAETAHRIKVRDLIAMAWLPLNKLSESGLIPEGLRVNPVQIYSSKGKCSQLFGELYEHPAISKQMANGKFELHSVAVGSAFDILVDLPELYDWIVAHLPETYNSNNGKFGRIEAVKMRSTITPYFQIPVDYDAPDGFITPLFYGLIVLMEVNEGRLVWRTNPVKFLERNFKQIVGAFKMPMEMAGFDPQKIAKSEGSYGLVLQTYKFALMEEHSTLM